MLNLLGKICLTVVRLIMKYFWLIVGFLGLVLFGAFALLSIKAHNASLATIYPLGVVIAVKLLIFTSNNHFCKADLRKVFFSFINIFWLAIWLTIYIVSNYAGLERGGGNG